ncbi:MAG: hypothetical protein EXS64_03230 [Candidatus Latescibacteria bacterium]|nr:hypothetical protein [Candidatus Latescibacterota bacterium]
MSPEAIQSIIEMFGVEKGLHILNMFTMTGDPTIAHLYKPPSPIRKRPAHLVRVTDPDRRKAS